MGDVVPQLVAEAIRDMAPLLERLAEGRHAVALGGSIGKGANDAGSDLDFRFFYDALASDQELLEAARAGIRSCIASWGGRGVVIDGCWPRRIADVEATMESQLAGGDPLPFTWTIWGYHALTDLAHLMVVSDRWGAIAGWKDRLRVYPATLKAAIIETHLKELRYWREDHHYRHKADRGGAVFCCGLAAKLIPSLMQILFALNETWYPGDGRNLEHARGFAIAPRDLEARVKGLLFLPGAGDAPARQRQALVALIDDVLGLV